jgi:hypothetical protein
MSEVISKYIETYTERAQSKPPTKTAAHTSTWQ